MFFFGGADFFFAKRLFFRYGEGCEGRALRATVAGEWGYNGENSFSAFIPIRLTTIGRQPSHPHRSGFFYSFHATYVPTYRNLEFVDFGAGEDFFVGLQNFIYFWKLKLEMGLSTSVFCPWLAQPQCGYRLIISV